MAFLLWLLAVVLVVAGIVAIVRKEWIYGIVLIVSNPFITAGQS